MTRRGGGRLLAPASDVFVRLPCAPSSPALARRLVADALRGWGMSEGSEAVAFVASELVTNAVVHARSALTLSLERHEGGVRLTVGDAGVGFAAPRTRDDRSTGGRGLQLVDALSVRWGQDVRPDGKRVWAEFPVTLVATG